MSGKGFVKKIDDELEIERVRIPQVCQQLLPKKDVVACEEACELIRLCTQHMHL